MRVFEERDGATCHGRFGTRGSWRAWPRGSATVGPEWGFRGSVAGNSATVGGIGSFLGIVADGPMRSFARDSAKPVVPTIRENRDCHGRCVKRLTRGPWQRLLPRCRKIGLLQPSWQRFLPRSSCITIDGQTVAGCVAAVVVCNVCWADRGRNPATLVMCND